MTPLRRCPMRGGAVLFSVLLIMAFAFAMLAVHHRERAATALGERREAAGRLFAAWFHAAHRASQEGDWRTAIEGRGIELLPGDLRHAGAVLPGLKEDDRIALGLIDDGNGVPMAFGVFTARAREAVSHIRSGALLGGLRRVGHAGSAAGPMAHHRGTIEAVLSRPLGGNALYVTADQGLEWRSDLLHRRPQPGRPWLNRMEGDLDAGASDILDASRIDAESLSGKSTGRAGWVNVAGSATAAGLEGAAGLDAGALEVLSLDVIRELSVGTLAASGPVAAADAAVTDHLQASLLTADELAAQTMVAGSGVTVAGEAALKDAATGSLAAAVAIDASGLATGRLFGPGLDVAGTLAVNRCAGC